MFQNIKSIFIKNKPEKTEPVKQEEMTRDITPHQYFNEVKERKQKIDDEGLQRVYDNCLELLNKFIITGQEKGIKKLMFHLDCVEKERELVKMGINTFVYKDDIEEYIDNIANDVVKIIELENYEREIPDEIIDVIYAVKEKNLFADSIMNRRCIIPASGFYEWDPYKARFRFSHPDDELLLLAGIYHEEHGAPDPHYTILTTQANESMIPVHDRMPVIISRDEIHPWLNDNEKLSDFLERPQLQLVCEQDSGQIRMDFGL